MTTQSDWIYCRLVDRGSVILPRKPFWLGQIELSETIVEDSACEESLVRSMQAFTVSETGEGWRRLVRARVLILDVNEQDALKAGEFHLDETLRSFNAHLLYTMGELRATDAGYLYDLRKGECRSLLPPWAKRSSMGTIGMLDELAHHPLHVLNTLHAAPTAYGELGHAFRRSAHWMALASRGEDESQTLLLGWMAAECICKEVHDEDIGTKLQACLGFLSGRFTRMVASQTLADLNALDGYRFWRKRLAQLFQVLRIARNGIVHSGYRQVDLPTVLPGESRELGLFVLEIANRCLSDLALQALNVHSRSISDVWSKFEAMFPFGLLHHSRWVLERLNSFSKEANSTMLPRGASIT